MKLIKIDTSTRTIIFCYTKLTRSDIFTRTIIFYYTKLIITQKYHLFVIWN